MSKFEIVGLVDENHKLMAEVPVQVPPGPVKIVLELQPPEDDDWAKWIAHAWAADWCDPREDIYSLEDGEPADGTR